MLAEGNKGHKLLEVLGPKHLQDVLVDISRSCKVSPVARWANELHLGELVNVRCLITFSCLFGGILEVEVLFKLSVVIRCFEKNNSP